jgi:hypothetical protein
MSAGPYLGMLYAVLFAAGISLVVSLVIFPASSNKLLAQHLIDILGTTSELLLTTLHLFQADSSSIHNLKDYRVLCERVIQIRHKISIDVENLRPVYEDARYELHFALFPLERYEAFINLSTKLQTTLVSRMGLKLSNNPLDVEVSNASSSPMSAGSNKPAYLRNLVDELGTMNVLALQAIRSALARSSYLSTVKGFDPASESTDKEAPITQELQEFFRDSELEKLRHRLDEIVDTFRTGIVDALDNALHESDEGGQRVHTLFRANVRTNSFCSACRVLTHRLHVSCQAFRDCFFFTSLVDLSNDIQDGLQLASELPRPSESSRRIWIPALSTLFETSKSTTTFSSNTEEDGESPWPVDFLFTSTYLT